MGQTSPEQRALWSVSCGEGVEAGLRVQLAKDTRGATETHGQRRTAAKSCVGHQAMGAGNHRC